MAIDEAFIVPGFPPLRHCGPDVLSYASEIPSREPVTVEKKKTFPQQKSGLHPRNRHRSRYDFPALIASCPALAPFVKPNAWGDVSVDFADPAAVKMLNRALLQHFYGIEHWDIPADYLCPPIPGRADYLHHLADLLATSNGGGSRAARVWRSSTSASAPTASTRSSACANTAGVSPGLKSIRCRSTRPR